MGKLTKPQLKKHLEACKLLEKETLTYDEKWFVLENWHEGADNNITQAGAYFTPMGLARDFAIDVTGTKIVDLCAGIGVLAFAYYHMGYHDGENIEITCIEINPRYVEVGKKILPEATWICADVFNVWPTLAKNQFDCAISNPPFGKVGGKGNAQNYTGAEFEYKIIDIASEIAEYGAFLLPQGSAPFRYSGAPYYQRTENRKFKTFHDQTGIEVEAGCGVDTTYHANDWKTAAPTTEIVCCEFENLAPCGQLSLFEDAA